MLPTMRMLELFSGIGGWRYALGGLISRDETQVVAYDISPLACDTYELNHGERPHARELASIPAKTLAAHEADLWAMSPPCQPFCRMGNRHGLEDRRSRAFLRLLEILPEAPPRALVLENVPGFRDSDARDRLCDVLNRLGFEIQEWQLCPTAFGIPNQRARYFMAASRDGLSTVAVENISPSPLADYLDADADPSLYLDEATLARHGGGMDFVRPEDRRSTCFIGGYGQRFVGSGSFLETPRGIRRFAPSEIARIMGLPEQFRFPQGLPMEARYKLLGNGLNIGVARWVMSHLLRDAEHGAKAAQCPSS
ncbi:MAG TPA: DNA cytosine methyltransferase [Holophaga sp.]|nr:DNA cytosine methyltransferase [Holophaga sp.]